MDELEKMKMQNKFLIDRVEQLQMKKPSSGKGIWTLNSLFLVWLNQIKNMIDNILDETLDIFIVDNIQGLFSLLFCISTIFCFIIMHNW